MTGDDRKLRKVGGHGVEKKRLAIFELDSHPAWQTCADARGSGMKLHGVFQFRALLPRRIKATIIGIEGLECGLKFQSHQSKLFDRSFCLFDRDLSFPRIDTGKAAKEGIREAFDDLS
ncbi:MAG: hypothetical protein Q8S00_20405 [Deltaproteobacteria bacterium]|nr:hypothetical protein [Deltaproteobacteria bacterium]